MTEMKYFGKVLIKGDPKRVPYLVERRAARLVRRNVTAPARCVEWHPLNPGMYS